MRLLPLSEIRPRPFPDLRGLNDRHVEALAWSIQALGLLQPIVVDRFGFLVAGAHRLEALRRLHERGDWKDPVPVRVLVGFEAQRSAREALLAEVAENDKRRDYTNEEVRELAERLKKAGFRHKRGRPGKGERPLLPALEAAVGKSRRRLHQILNGPSESPEAHALIALRRLRAAAKGALSLCHGQESPEMLKLSRDVQRILRRIDRLLE